MLDGADAGVATPRLDGAPPPKQVQGSARSSKFLLLMKTFDPFFRPNGCPDGGFERSVVSGQEAIQKLAKLDLGVHPAVEGGRGHEPKACISEEEGAITGVYGLGCGGR